MGDVYLYYSTVGDVYLYSTVGDVYFDATSGDPKLKHFTDLFLCQSTTIDDLWGVVYFNQLSGAAHSWMLFEKLFAVFNLFC